MTMMKSRRIEKGGMNGMEWKAWIRVCCGISAEGNSMLGDHTGLVAQCFPASICHKDIQTRSQTVKNQLQEAGHGQIYT